MKKTVTAENYNYIFDDQTGYFVRWGNHLKDDPQFSPLGPEIADIEIVQGDCKGNCAFCYKSNGEVENKYMDLETYKKVLDKLPDNLCQVAFGITDIDANPDFFKIMEYTREMGVIPNYTTHGLDITDEIARKTKELCGAVAVSIVNKQKTYNTIKRFTDVGMTQVNIHYMISEETYNRAFEIIDDMKIDPRLEKMNALVFLSLKPKGRGQQYNNLSVEKYRKLVDYALTQGIRIGFDSCSAPLFLSAVKESPHFDYYRKIAEPCESYLFSIYINTFGECTPCSFMEDEDSTPLSILECDDFMKDIWFNPEVIQWRDKLLDTEKKCNMNCRMCPYFSIYNKELLNEN